jgi:hypothetical protein
MYNSNYGRCVQLLFSTTKKSYCVHVCAFMAFFINFLRRVITEKSGFDSEYITDFGATIFVLLEI